MEGAQGKKHLHRIDIEFKCPHNCLQSQGNPLLGSVDTAENPDRSSGLSAEDSTLLGGEVLAGRNSAPLVLVRLASDLVGLGDLDTLDAGVNIDDLELGDLDALVGAEDAEGHVERKRFVAVISHHRNADVILLLHGGGHGAGYGEETGENGGDVHDCGGALKVDGVGCSGADC